MSFVGNALLGDSLDAAIAATPNVSGGNLTGTYDSGSLDTSGGIASGNLAPDWFQLGGFSNNSNQSPNAISTPSATVTGQGTNTTAGGTAINNAINNLPGTVGNALSGGANTVAGWLGLPSLSQAIAIILGLVMIAGGIFLLSKGPAVNVVSGAAKELVTGA